MLILLSELNYVQNSEVFSVKFSGLTCFEFAILCTMLAGILSSLRMRISLINNYTVQ